VSGCRAKRQGAQLERAQSGDDLPAADLLDAPEVGWLRSCAHADRKLRRAQLLAMRRRSPLAGASPHAAGSPRLPRDRGLIPPGEPGPRMLASRRARARCGGPTRSLRGVRARWARRPGGDEVRRPLRPETLRSRCDQSRERRVRRADPGTSEATRANSAFGRGQERLRAISVTTAADTLPRWERPGAYCHPFLRHRWPFPSRSGQSSFSSSSSR
jgi:hypothetical protein